MASHFEKLTEAKKEYKKRTGVDFSRSERHSSGLSIYNRNRAKWRKKKLKKPYFVGSYMEWLNL